jgi:hypothetical protein
MFMQYLIGQAFSERMRVARIRKRVRAYLALVGSGYESNFFTDTRRGS